MKLQMIEWLDAHSRDDWSSDVLNEPVFCRSVGWVLHEDDRTVTLVGTIGSHEQHFAELCLPRGCIVKRADLSA